MDFFFDSFAKFRASYNDLSLLPPIEEAFDSFR